MGLLGKKNEKGQSLIEALVALGAAVLVVSAISVTVISALNNVQYTRDQNIAGQYAQESIEVMRQMSLSNWTQFSSYNQVRYCMAAGPAPLTTVDPITNSCGLNDSGFQREVDIEQNSAQCQGGGLVTAIVSWGDSKCTDPNNTYCHNVTLSSCFSNINGNIFSTP